MSLFEEADDPQGGPAVTPGPVLEPLGTGNVSLPDPTPIVQNSFPRIPLPPPPTPPPQAMQDPRQRMLATMAMLFAAGAGPRCGVGSGALAGINQASNEMHADSLRRWQYDAQQSAAQRKIVEEEQARQDTQRATEYQTNLEAFRRAASQAKDQPTYDALAESYGKTMQARGWRMLTPNWFRQNIPYVRPDKVPLADKALTNWLSLPSNKRLADEHPEQAATTAIAVDLNGDGRKEELPLGVVAEMAGKGFAHTATGVVAVPKTQPTGTSAFDVKYQALISKFSAENGGRTPTPQENDKLVDQAILASKEKPATDPRDHFTFVPGVGADGKPLIFRGNTSTGELGPYAPPGGGTLGKPVKTQLAGAQADQLSAMNMAEVEGVKVLRALQQAGLTNSNNPADARWQKFVATTLKMESGDFNKADIQQRTAAVNAVLTRGLMGGRPSQYVAEMIQQHMPQGEMTGAKLTQIMNDVLQQTGERRKEFENLTGRELGSLAPVSGETYDAFRSSEQQALDAVKERLKRRGAAGR